MKAEYFTHQQQSELHKAQSGGISHQYLAVTCKLSYSHQHSLDTSAA